MISFSEPSSARLSADKALIILGIVSSLFISVFLDGPSNLRLLKTLSVGDKFEFLLLEPALSAMSFYII